MTMRGKKAKALRNIIGYSVTEHRPVLPGGIWAVWERGTMVIAKDHPRHKYQFMKKRYGMIPLAHALTRTKRSSKFVERVDQFVSQQVAA